MKKHIGGAPFARGITLIELLVVLALVGLLTAMAVPAMTQHWRKARRLDGVTALARIQMAQEQFRNGHAQYADGFISSSGHPDGMLVRMADAAEASRVTELRSTDGHYRLSVVAADRHGYRLTATAQGSQAGDTGCAVLLLKLEDGVAIYLSGDGASVVHDESSLANRRCWNR